MSQAWGMGGRSGLRPKFGEPSITETGGGLGRLLDRLLLVVRSDVSGLCPGDVDAGRPHRLLGLVDDGRREPQALARLRCPQALAVAAIPVRTIMLRMATSAIARAASMKLRSPAAPATRPAVVSVEIARIAM
jgi:hypothetical protein